MVCAFRKFALVTLACLGLATPAFADGARPLFQPPKRPDVPRVQNAKWPANAVDHFVLAKLEANGLTPSRPAEKLRLLRRVTYDLTGLPPTIEEQEAFLSDDSPDAYAKVVDRLLASPRYGERQATFWLDLVRYAETDGFKADDYRPEAHKYRDYVIRAFNADLPYDRFLRQQLAGDELEPDNPEARIATGFLRLYPDEYNAANLEQRRQEILDDVTDTVGHAFLGMTFACARCHDHKFDPILQSDYFQLQAFFANMQARDDLPVASPAALKKYREDLAAWEKATADVRKEIEALTEKKRQEMRKKAAGKFRKEIQDAIFTPADKRTPYQEIIAWIAEPQLERELKTLPKSLSAEDQKRYEELTAKLPAKPAAPLGMTVTDHGKDAPPTYLLSGGDWRKPKQKIDPSFPSYLPKAAPDTTLPDGVTSTGRRAALARWVADPKNPLTARVMVNRLWQHHFGVGIVPNGNDFGAMGEPATHLELLDWLAVEFAEKGWSVKHIHRLILLSATYRQDSLIREDDAAQKKAMKADPENNLLWHQRRHRLEGEAIRDSMLLVSNQLNLRMYGTSARPKLPPNVSSYAWKPDAKEEDQNRRSVYVFVKRNLRYPLLDAFDWPDLHNSCSRRAMTTTAPQALLLLNGDFTKERATALGSALLKEFDKDDHALVSRAYRLAWNRPASPDEVKLGVSFLAKQTALLEARKVTSEKPPRQQAVIDLVHAILNTNEFLYID